MIKKIRVSLTLITLILLTLLFLNISSGYSDLFSFLAKFQLLSAVLSFSFGVFSFWLAVTLLFGRAYCSSICPMGTLQDIFAWLGKRGKKRNNNSVFYRYSTPKNRLRYAILVGFCIFVFLGLLLIPNLIDPYSAYGRIANAFFKPVYVWISTNEINRLVLPTFFGFAVAFITLVAVGWMSYRHGRIVCNTICPVGSTLSLVSRHSVWQMEIDPDMCVHCGKCSANCKSSCINLREYTIDTSRCVMCFNCLDVCNDNAIRYTASRKRLSTPLMQPIEDAPPPVTTLNLDRRKFLSAIGLIAGSATVIKATDKVNNASAQLQGLKPINRNYAVTPPGIISREDFHKHCTACMLCVSNCPTKVLKASTVEYSIFNALQPTMDFEASHCRYDCTQCTQVCPTKALTPLTKEEKHDMNIGKAQYIQQNCIVVRNNISCGRCAVVCPKDTIKMIPFKNGYKIPIVNLENCIGCGACENICPAKPIKAIWVEGNPN